MCNRNKEINIDVDKNRIKRSHLIDDENFINAKQKCTVRKNVSNETKLKNIMRKREKRKNTTEEDKFHNAKRMRENRKITTEEEKLINTERMREYRKTTTEKEKLINAERMRKYRTTTTEKEKLINTERMRIIRLNTPMEIKDITNEYDRKYKLNTIKNVKTNNNAVTDESSQINEKFGLVFKSKLKLHNNKTGGIKITKIGMIANTNFDESLINCNYLGKLDYECTYCAAKHFKVELSKDKKFKNCFHKHKILLKETTPYPKELLSLFNKESPYYAAYIKNIRLYNNNLAFASFGAKLVHINTPGPQVLKINGQVYHNSYALHPNENENPKYGQLYILDNEIANNYRTENMISANPNVELLNYLSNFLTNSNPYAHAYKMMFEVEKEEIGKALSQNTKPKNVIMLLTREDYSNNKSSFASCNEVAVVYVGDDGEPPIERDICIYPKSESPNKIHMISRHVDPMVYPLIFPYGDCGWKPHMKSLSANTNKNISALQYYSYQLSIRDDFNPCLNLKNLTQQFIPDIWTRIEGNRLFYIKNNQSQIRGELYKGLMDHLSNKADEEKCHIGKQIILPSSFTGSPRAIQQNYLDAMCQLQKFGKPDLFLTMTCNPNWKEIKENLLPHETTLDRPDLISRVFNEKVKLLKCHLLEKKIFGNVMGFVYVVEFQKRGLPHIHMLVWLDENDKLHNTDDIDKLISAEIPNINNYPKLYELVKNHMIHGPCGLQNLNCACMSEDKSHCTKNFPKPFTEKTDFISDSYPSYRRRNDGNKIVFGKNRVADNRFVVPYNPYLLLLLECHINVEICSTIMAIKYLFKYIYKGPDTALLKFVSDNGNKESDQNENTCLENINVLNYDEVTQYISTRYICAPEAMFRILEYKLHEQSHCIYRLSVHLPDEQFVFFKEGFEEKLQDRNYVTTLTAWFQLNINDKTATKYLYPEIPYHYVFSNECKKWIIRKKFQKPIISRLYFVNPKQRETYYLRMLLFHVRGAKSFEDLRTVDGILHEKFEDACKAQGLIIIDKEWDECLAEASSFKFPNSLCELFTYILIFHNPPNASELFHKYKKEFFDPKLPLPLAESNVLLKIDNMLSKHNMSIIDFGIDIKQGDDDNVNNFVQQPNINAKIEEFSDDTLTTKQKLIFDKILTVLENKSNDKLFFIDGPGGSGKSYLHNVLIEHLKSININFISVAWTGIAANLLTNGKTVHTAFKLPLNINEQTTCNITPNSKYGQYIKTVSVIIWDEISMASKHAFEAIDRLLKDLCETKEPFGGKIIILSGDFRQILPVVRHGSRTKILESCVKTSPLWNFFKKYSLTDNLRLKNSDNNFKNWLLSVGDNKNSTHYEIQNNVKEVPEEFICKKNLITEIYGECIDPQDPTLKEKVILATLNSDVLKINEDIVQILNGESRTYLSVDRHENDSEETITNSIPIEFLNSLTPNGLPPHKLTLKKGCIVILLRNLDLDGGLCNGSRLIVKDMNKYILTCEMITGQKKNKIVLLPRIDLTPSLDEIPFKMVRRQFPVRLGFALTINKVQGQSFDTVGIMLRTPVFSHGQLYVALSRVRLRQNLKISLNDDDLYKNEKKNTKIKHIDKNIKSYVKNIVYDELFAD